MLWAIFVILLALWLQGLVSGHTMGGVIHVLLVIAIIVLAVRLIQERRVLYRRGPLREGEASGKEVGGRSGRPCEWCDIFGRKDLVINHFHHQIY